MSNFHADLAVQPSTRECIRLAGSAQQALQTARGADEGEYEAAQDIDKFGIAGRTWEAAYAMQLYCSPPPTPTASTSAVPTFAPPNALFTPSPSARTIIEIGSGTGFLSLSLAPHLPAGDTLVLTDLDEVIPLMSENLSSAQAHSKSSGDWPRTLVRGLGWGDEAALQEVLGEVGAPDVILASDLVYFPALYPPLLRTCIGLTSPPPDQNPSPQKEQLLLFSYKVRSFPREEPFWNAFGHWFEFEPVLLRTPPPPPTREEDARGERGEESYTRFGTGEDEIYVFVCTRKRSTLGTVVPESDGELMSLTDDQFERLLMCEIDFS